MSNHDPAAMRRLERKVAELVREYLTLLDSIDPIVSLHRDEPLPERIDDFHFWLAERMRGLYDEDGALTVDEPDSPSGYEVHRLDPALRLLP